MAVTRHNRNGWITGIALAWSAAVLLPRAACATETSWPDLITSPSLTAGGLNSPEANSTFELPADLNVVPATTAEPAAELVPSATDREQSQAIGTPNSMFSARPAREAAATEAGFDGSGWMGWIDPRQNELARVGLALAVVITALFGLRAIIRRVGNIGGAGRPGGVIEVLARYPVARGQHLQLIKLGRRVLLIFQSGSTMTTLTEMTDQNEVAMVLAKIEAASRGKDAERFREMLAQYQMTERGPARLAAVVTPAAESRRPVEVLTEKGPIVDLTKRKRRWNLVG